MNLYVLRHGIAVEHRPDFDNDADRPLTGKGKCRIRQIADAMREMELSFDLIFSSPFPRARQTAEIVAAVFKRQKKLACTNELMPEGSAKVFVEQLNKIKPSPENILLVGHEPYLSRFIGLLAAGNPDSEIDLKKGGLCKLEIESLRHGRCAKLAWLLTPRQMKLMIQSC
jgi:phosphohistidine phosphatase